MISKIIPDFYVSNLQEVPVNRLKNLGIKGLIIDLDNTLTFWNSIYIRPSIDEWLQNQLSYGFKICIVSNNSTGRIKASLENRDLPFVPYALKPSKRAFLKAMKIIDTRPLSTAVIGDQLFTDIVGGKRIGAYTVLVQPLSPKEFFWTRIVRKLEKLIINKYHLK